MLKRGGKCAPGPPPIGTAGAGSATHLGCSLLNAAAGIDVTHVPYRGGSPAMQDVVAGRIDYLCIDTPLAVPLIFDDVASESQLAGC